MTFGNNTAAQSRQMSIQIQEDVEEAQKPVPLYVPVKEEPQEETPN